MSKTTAWFIAKAQSIHGDLFDYSKTEYKNAKTKVTIICRTHGEFEQLPASHYKKTKIAGCPTCKGTKRLTLDDFIIRARDAHGDKYDYSRVEIVTSETPVTIGCPTHGWFQQTPYQHYKGFECKRCGAEKAKLSSRTTYAEFVAKALNIHGDVYDYSKVKFNTTNDKVTIVCKIHGDFSQIASGHISGRGCRKCGGTAPLTTDEFIRRSIVAHGNRYDYSFVDYKAATKKVVIVCTKHGPFYQLPPSHLKGSGCIKCANVEQLTTEEFIKRAQEIHGNKYDYSQVEYEKASIKVSIRCIEHNYIFEQTPTGHLGGAGCHICGGSMPLTTEMFIRRVREVHGDKYDYSKTAYISNKVPVAIICFTHGLFQQMPSAHLKGHGCAKCANVGRLTTEEFVTRARRVHGDKYDYSQVNYEYSIVRVTIKCVKHNKSFQQTPNAHLYGRGCPLCSFNSISKAQNNWLEFIESYYGISTEREYLITNTKWRADGYHKDSNTVFEFHGDFWHGNPKIYDPSQLNAINGKSMGTLYKRTAYREERIKELGYNLVVIWESEWNMAIKLVKMIQRKFRSTK